MSFFAQVSEEQAGPAETSRASGRRVVGQFQDCRQFPRLGLRGESGVALLRVGRYTAQWRPAAQ